MRSTKNMAFLIALKISKTKYEVKIVQEVEKTRKVVSNNSLVLRTTTLT